MPTSGAALPDPAAARRRPPRQRAQRPRRAAVERLGGHLPRPGRLGRGLPDRRPRERRRASGGGLRAAGSPRPGGARAVGRGAALQGASGRSTSRANTREQARAALGRSVQRGAQMATPHGGTASATGLLAAPRGCCGSSSSAGSRRATAKPGADHERGLEALGQRVGMRDAGLSSESRRELAIAARIARPSAPPICCDVLIRPEARPASCGSTPATAAIVIGTNAKPRPNARRSATGTGCRRRRCRPTEICENHSRPTAVSSRPRDQHRLDAEARRPAPTRRRPTR